MARVPKPPATPALAELETRVIQFIHERRYAEAAKARADYNATLPVPIGIGVDWKHYDTHGDVVALTAICEGPLQSDCVSVDRTSEPAIRLAAALMLLFGASKPYRRWLAADVPTGLPFSADQVAQTLVLAGYAARQNAHWDKARASGIEIPESYYRRLP